MSVGLAPAVPLKDVEWRLDSEPKDGDRGMRARFVPHINARTAAALMDEWVGPCGWSQSDAVVTIAGKEAVQCTVSVWDGEQWVSKQDVGVASHTEPQKGAVSDAFKRVVTVKWGAGRNVYELPTLWAPCKAVTGRDQKVRGYATDATLPDLLRQLKQRGFDADGCRLEAGASDENAEAGHGGVSTGTAAAGRSDGDSLSAGGNQGSRPSSASATSPAAEQALESTPAAAGGDGSPAAPPISKARREKLKSRCVALQADGISVADEREALHLPLVDSCNEAQIALFEQLVTDLEAKLAAPFKPSPA